MYNPQMHQVRPVWDVSKLVIGARSAHEAGEIVLRVLHCAMFSSSETSQAVWEEMFSEGEHSRPPSLFMEYATSP